MYTNHVPITGAKSKFLNITYVGKHLYIFVYQSCALHYSCDWCTCAYLQCTYVRELGFCPTMKGTLSMCLQIPTYVQGFQYFLTVSSQPGQNKNSQTYVGKHMDIPIMCPSLVQIQIPQNM
jgi:hypothetical protein